MIQDVPEKLPWESVVLPKALKDELIETITFPLEFWKQRPHGKINLLLYGVTGTGKDYEAENDCF